jgi:MOSC domain-containing protein YiiM
MGRIESIVYKPEDAEKLPEGYTRIPLQEAHLVVGGGIEGDLKGRSHTRQLNIMSADTVRQLAEEGFGASPGQLGEQLTVADLDIDRLPIGAHLQIGESARVEVVEPRTGCGKFERYQGRTKEEATGRLGVMARVIAAGPIRVGDPVCVVGATDGGER